MLMQGCSEDFLDRPPLDAITSGNFYKTDDEILAGTAPLYNIVWFDFNDKANMAFLEARAGNLNSNDRTAYIKHAIPSTDVNTLLPGYKSFYKIIAQSNNAYKAIKDAQGSTASAAGTRPTSSSRSSSARASSCCATRRGRTRTAPPGTWRA